MVEKPAKPSKIDRRTFLRRTLVGSALLAIGGAVGVRFAGRTVGPAIAARLRVLSAKECFIFVAIARRLLGSGAEEEPSAEEVAVAADGYLSSLPHDTVNDVRALLVCVEHCAPFLCGHLSRFSRLDDAAQDDVLAALAESRIDVARVGFQALKGLAAWGYYGDARSWSALGYGGPLGDVP